MCARLLMRCYIFLRWKHFYFLLDKAFLKSIKVRCVQLPLVKQISTATVLDASHIFAVFNLFLIFLDENPQGCGNANDTNAIKKGWN